MDRIRRMLKLTNELKPGEFDDLLTVRRPHILEQICLSLDDYETLKNCLEVNSDWREVLTNKVFIKRVQSTFKEDINYVNDQNTLIQMSAAGDEEGVRRILSGGLIKVDCIDEKFEHWQQIGPRTPLIYAATDGYADIVRLLIEAGADVNQEGPVNSTGGPDNYEHTPLMVAANYNHFAVVRLLIEAGAHHDKVDKFGKTPLRLAICPSNVNWIHDDRLERNPIAVMTLLIDNGADVNHADEYGTTPLIAAAYMGDCEAASLLLDRGANIEKVSSTSRRSPLMTAADENNTDMMRLLIRRGANLLHGDLYNL